MQKKLIALAIASMATSAAFAQSADSVVLYGRADIGVVSRSGMSNGVGADKRTTEIKSGIASGSRIGVKGTENLGNGTKALFLAEFGIDVDNGVDSGATTWWNRQSYAGLQNDSAGTLLIGRQYGLRYLTVLGKYDVFAGGTVGNMTQLTGSYGANRANNAIAYVSPKFAGLQATVAYSAAATTQELAQNIDDKKYTGGHLNYANGPIEVSLYGEKVKVKDAANGKSAVGLGLAYNIKGAKIAAILDRYTDKTGVSEAKENAIFLNAKIPVGNVAIKLGGGINQNKSSYDNAAGKSTKLGFGIDYSLSKRTTVYADYGRISTKDGGTFLNQVNTAVGNGDRGTKGFDLGVAHTF